jgi:hypothetical protein
MYLRLDLKWGMVDSNRLSDSSMGHVRGGFESESQQYVSSERDSRICLQKQVNHQYFDMDTLNRFSTSPSFPPCGWLCNLS